MKNRRPFGIPPWEWVIVVLASIVIIGACVLWPQTADAQQFRYGAGPTFHANNGPHIGVQAISGVKVGKWEFQTDAQAIPFSSQVYTARYFVGITAGYFLPVFDDGIRIYAGGYRRFTGNKTTMDRYKPNASTTTILSQGWEKNGWNATIGLQYVKEWWMINAGAIPHKDSPNYFISIIFFGSTKND